MKAGKRFRRGCALALAVLLGLSGLVQIRTQAATGIETGRLCTLTVSVADSEYKEDFNEMKIPVSLYRVADVDVSGRYAPVEPFKGMDFSSLGSETKAEDWTVLAEEAVKCLEGTEVPAVQTKEAAAAEGSTEAAGAVFEDLATGLYLVVPEAAYNKDYTVRYLFTPYLTALPSSEYTLTGAGSDEWNYDTVIGLKAEGEPQYGRLNITKVLSNYNETLGRTSFVFQVEGRDETGALVYSNVISTTHEGAGSETVTLGQIPAGLTVKVTEVYSGASYELVDSLEKDALVWSDAAVVSGEHSEASVSFTNRYGGGNRGGYGVTNHFDSDGSGGWTWVNPMTESPATPEE